MLVLKDTQEVAKKLGRVVVALGNFDGVHIGHQRLVRQMVVHAQKTGAAGVVFTFHPHPLHVLYPDKAPQLLISPEKRTELIARLGVDALLMVPFNRDLARLSPEFFVHDILHRQLGSEAVFVGFNFTFGHRGAGTPELLGSLGKELGFTTEVLPPVQIGETIISSTVVRKALEEGDIGRARRYLGYWPILEGRVVLGDQRGRQIGFPTANLNINNNVLIPARGVYVAQVRVGDRVYDGVVNIGVKPTFGQAFAPTVEVHILEFTQVIYDEWVQLSLLHRLRSEVRFSSVTELITQIKQDIEAARLIKTKVLHNQA
jgi:riboflavin kinase/FMN adenylyltransferase